MNKRQQRENLTRAKALFGLIQLDSSGRTEMFQSFVCSCHTQNVPIRAFTQLEELADYMIAGVFHCYGDKIPEPLFRAIAAAVFGGVAQHLALDKGNMEVVRSLLACLDKYLIKNGSIPCFDELHINQFEEIVAHAQNKALNNLHLTQKVQERRVML